MGLKEALFSHVNAVLRMKGNVGKKIPVELLEEQRTVFHKYQANVTMQQHVFTGWDNSLYGP